MIHNLIFSSVTRSHQWILSSHTDSSHTDSSHVDVRHRSSIAPISAIVCFSTCRFAAMLYSALGRIRGELEENKGELGESWGEDINLR